MDMRRKESKRLLETVRKRYKLMVDKDNENRDLALEDIRFVNLPGEQWEENMRQERGERPCYEYNKTRIRCKRVINDMRDNRPSGKVRPVEGGDKEGAEIREGLIRNIWNTSHADNATDYAAEFQVEGGMGAWRLNTRYADDSAFEQDIAIESVENPFCLYVDPGAKEFMKRDARDWIFTERISYDEFEDRYGESVEKSNFESDDGFDDDDWIDDETVRIAEYWYKVPHKKDLWLIQAPNAETGELETKVIDSESDEGEALRAQGFEPERTRTVETHKIMMCVASGSKIIEGPTEWAGNKFPWVMLYGEFKVIEGRKRWWGLVRFAKDAQRNYNISKTSIAETIAQSSKSKDWVTPDQAEGLTDQWALAHKQNLPFQLYNPDPKAPGPPQRVGGAEVPVALMQQAAIDNEDLKDVMGLPDASMGQSGDEKSGRAIYARQQQGEIATFNYKDNMAKAVEYTYELLLDLIPEIYDTERELRILGADGAEDYKRVNQVVQNPQTGQTVTLNDMSAGRYDTTITVGPAFSTLRQEAAEIYGELGRQFPLLMQLAGDLIFKSMDLPYAEDISERLRTMLPPEIQSLVDGETEIPPEVQALMAQAEQAMAQVQEYGKLVQEANAELQEEKALNDQQKADIKTEAANLRASRAEAEARIAEQMSKLIQQAAGLTEKEAKLLIKGAEVKEAAVSANVAMDDRDDSALDISARIDETLASFMQAADSAIGEMQAVQAGLERKADRKPVSGTIKREGGTLAADVEFDDGTTKSINAVRDKGVLRIVPDSEGESED